MRPQLLSLLLSICCLQLSAQNTENLEVAVYFETASAQLTPSAQTALQELSDQILGMGDYHLELAAHTDSRGTNRYNDRLARDRARSVERFLKEQGITTDNMETLALGESQAGDDTDNEQLQQTNRRVDVLIQGWYWQGVGNLQDSLANPLVQQYTVDPSKDQLIEGEKGGQFYISANSFVTLDGEAVNSPVDIELTECYSLGDMISLGLTTTAQERILESGGMLRLTASSNGQPLQLKDGRSIGAAVPTPEFQQDMSLFYGQSHGENEGELDWVNTQDPVQSQMPQLRLAQRPLRPVWTYYGQLYLSTPDYSKDPRRPKEPTGRKPLRPRTPNYDKIIYRPTGLQKVFMSKTEKAARTAELRDKKQADYEEGIKRFEERTAAYHAARQKYEEDLAAYQLLLREEIDERGFLASGPEYEQNKAKADADFEQATIQYRVDSTRYEKYKAYKMEQYEQQLEAFGSIDAKALGTYFFNLNQMGWANIDKFFKETETTRILAQETEVQTGEKAMVFLMIPERNIILRMAPSDDGQFALNQIPVGEKAKVIALKVENQKAYFATQEAIITDDLILALDYRPGRLRDIRAELSAI
ncbi:MAG: OmpA family protein [Bacteroidota bacterium]